MNFSCTKCGRFRDHLKFNYRVRSYSPLNCTNSFALVEIVCPDRMCNHINHSVLVDNVVENLTNLEAIFHNALHGVSAHHYTLKEAEFHSVSLLLDYDRGYMAFQNFQKTVSHIASTTTSIELRGIMQDLSRLDVDGLLKDRRYTISFVLLCEYYGEIKRAVQVNPDIEACASMLITYWGAAINTKQELRFGV